ncbi:MAG: hypothetical protein L0241_18595 [Planctomycetia bacterium]|nr:hypothetical protein [Planctomycetia bacterium]
MSSRSTVCRGWFWAVAFVAMVALSAGSGSAQPPSPLELVRGLRENGQGDLALEYLKEIENKPLSPNDKGEIFLEKAKCLLELSEDEPDEGKRLGMIKEAKEALNVFRTNHAKHPRVVEGVLALAQLTSVEARLQLRKAQRMEISEDHRDNDLAKQKKAAADARPMFEESSKRYAEASKILRAKLADKTLEPITRKTLQREAFEADLASGINQFNIAQTYMKPLSVDESKKRNVALELAKDTFLVLADPKANPQARTVWIARAWIAEVIYEQDDFGTAEKEVAAILKANVLEAEEGKRLVRYFQIRRNFLLALNENNMTKVQASVKELNAWRFDYDKLNRKPTPEVYTVRFYLAAALHLIAETNIKKNPTKRLAEDDKRLEDAEKLYRVLSQTDNEYTERAVRKRLEVVRLMVNEGDQRPAFYRTFEKAQMASLVQLSKLNQAQQLPATTPEERMKKFAEIKKRQLAIIALLERSRELAGPQENPADVTDVYLRLIYFYLLTDQPHQAAVLGDFVARTLKTTGGKASLAGLLGMTGYLIAANNVNLGDPDATLAARKVDRDRAIQLARFLDERYPNDNSTDAARHRLANLLIEDKLLIEAFEMLVKVRPSYAQITNVRLLEGYLASELVKSDDPKLTKQKKLEVFKRAVADLGKVPRPLSIAPEEEVRGYISTRCRLATLLFLQWRVDPAAEAANPGYNQALTIAQDVIALIPTLDCLIDRRGGMKALNLNGMEMNLLGQDTYARAVFLRSRALTESGKLPEAAQTLEPTLTAIRTNGALYTDQLKVWDAGRGDLIDPKKPDTEDNRDPPDIAAQKRKIAEVARGVDKTRVEVILSAFRLQVKLNKPADAEAVLNLMVQAGGTIEDSLPVLEGMGREMAVQLTVFEKEGKQAEVAAMKTGLAVLLKKIITAKNLPPSSVLFVGQTLQVVGENDKAIEMLKKVPPPAFAEWDTKDPEKFPAEVRGQLLAQTRDYATAQLYIARALRESKKLAEAEDMLTKIIGTSGKPNWGWGRLYFRKELALVYEKKGAAETDPKKAQQEWGKALQIWGLVSSAYRNRIANAKDATEDQLKMYRNTFADTYLDSQRCFIEANLNLLPRGKKEVPPERYKKLYDDVAKQFVSMEKQLPAAQFQPEVQHRYVELLDKYAPLKASYKAAGGKLFLEKLPLP